jgi:transcriptional regulator
MHPSRAFAWSDREAMLDLVREVSFCTIVMAAEGRPVVVHAPVVRTGPDRLQFHVSRVNRAASGLEGSRALISCLGPDGYISPDWYGIADQVPTWNYLAVECEGPLRRLSEGELAAHLDALSAEQEGRLAPKPVWTRDKMSPGRFEAMLRAITGFEMAVEELRGTRKLGQNKGVEARMGAVAGLRASGHRDIAELMAGLPA